MDGKLNLNLNKKNGRSHFEITLRAWHGMAARRFSTFKHSMRP